MTTVQVLCTNPGCGKSFSISGADLSAGGHCPSCGHRFEAPSIARPSASPALADGSSFGRYRIVRRLGHGGMGTVYLALDTQLQRQVALKVPHLEERPGSDALERFYREARSAAALDHPNLCPIYDVGQVDGSPYLTMAFVEGRPLSELIRRQAEWPQRQVAAVVRKLALALQEAHDRGVIHRDLKPANILVSRRKELVVVDFGLARRDGAGDARLTQSGVILGTPAYMAPEQVAGDIRAIGPCSDVYALGVILYELLTGQLPFEGPVALVLGQVMMAEPEPPSKTRPDVDPRLEAACLKAMAKKPGERHASMAGFAEALAGYLRGDPAVEPSISLAEMPTADGPATPHPTGGESLVGHFFEQLISRQDEVPAYLAATPGMGLSAKMPPRRRRKTVVAAGLAAILALGLGVGFAVLRRDGKAGAPTGSSPAKTPASIAKTPEGPPRQITNSIGMRMVLLPSGEFELGSPAGGANEFGGERPRHRVKIANPFYVNVYEVTQREYEIVMQVNPSHFATGGGGGHLIPGGDGSRHPVEQVSWLDAVLFCNALSRKEGLIPFYNLVGGTTVNIEDPAGDGYRLPREAEWEYACRAGSKDDFSFGNDNSILSRYAWYGEYDQGSTHPVGQKQPNAFGLYDLHGNVYEWCWDWFDKDHDDNPLKFGDMDAHGPSRVFRGGCWRSEPPSARCSWSHRRSPFDRVDTIGFRPVRTFRDAR